MGTWLNLGLTCEVGGLLRETPERLLRNSPPGFHPVISNVKGSCGAVGGDDQTEDFTGVDTIVHLGDDPEGIGTIGREAAEVTHGRSPPAGEPAPEMEFPVRGVRGAAKDGRRFRRWFGGELPRAGEPECNAATRRRIISTLGQEAR